MNDELKTALVSLISVVIANWVVIAPLMKTIIKTAWEKSIQWRDMQIDVLNLKELVKKQDKDIHAAFDKIRELEKSHHYFNQNQNSDK